MIKVQVNYATGEVQIVDVEVAQGGGGGGGGAIGVRSVVAGSNVTVDSTDPHNPIVSSTGGGGTAGIPEYTSDPASPTAEDAWVLRSGSAGGYSLMGFIGGFPLIDTGAGGYTYQFSYYTNEGTIIRTALS